MPITQLTNLSVSTSLIQTGISSASVQYFLNLLIESDSGSRKVLVFPNAEYQFTFYDADSLSTVSATGLVLDVSESMIKIKVAPERISRYNRCKCSIKTCKRYNVCINGGASSIYGAEPPMPTCNCILNPPDTDSKYADPTTYYIPIANLLNVKYIAGNNGPGPNKPNNSKKEDTVVMILGITATTVKAIVVRLKLIDDSLEDAIKYVDLEVGGIYNIAYVVREGRGCKPTIYESVAKIVSIEEVAENCVQRGKGFVRENVGIANTVYTSCDCSTDKDAFMNGAPVKHIKLVVDTSEDFSGRYESIMLDAIRDCTLIQSADGELADIIPDEDTTDTSCCINCPYKTDNCDHHNCGHYHHVPPTDCVPEDKVFKLDDGSTVTISRDGTVTYQPKDNTVEPSETTIKEIFNFYFGIN